MQIQISTDRTVPGGEELIRHFEGELAAKLARFSDHITRLEGHFSEDSVAEACRGAVHELESVLEGGHGRMDHHQGGDSIRHQGGRAAS